MARRLSAILLACAATVLAEAPAGAYVGWGFPPGVAISDLRGLTVVNYDPTGRPYGDYFWAQNIYYVHSDIGQNTYGYIGFQSHSNGTKDAWFSAWGNVSCMAAPGGSCAPGADGQPGATTSHPFNWVAGHVMETRARYAWTDSGDVWEGSIRDETVGGPWVVIGYLRQPYWTNHVDPSDVGQWIEYFGLNVPCSYLPPMDVIFYSSEGYDGAGNWYDTSQTATGNQMGGNGCYLYITTVPGPGSRQVKV